MTSSGRSALPIYVGILLAAVAATLTLAFLLVPESAQNDRFNLALGFILFGEVVAFSYVAWLDRLRDPRGATFPYHLGTSYVVVAYVIGVLTLAGVSATEISFEWLQALYVVLNFVLVVTFLVIIRGGRFITDLDSRRKDRRRFMLAFRDEVSEVRGLADSSTDDVLRGIRSAFDSFEEELAYSPIESLPGSESFDSQLQAGLGSIRSLLQSGSDATGEPEASGSSDAAAQIERELEEMKRVLKRRQVRLKQLR